MVQPAKPTQPPFRCAWSAALSAGFVVSGSSPGWAFGSSGEGGEGQSGDTHDPRAPAFSRLSHPPRRYSIVSSYLSFFHSTPHPPALCVFPLHFSINFYFSSPFNFIGVFFPLSFLALPLGKWALINSPTRDRACAPCTGSVGS